MSASKLPDFEGLAMFAKVAEERSFAGAARSMGVSVATVSRAVSRLEDRLGGRLFNRSSRGLALTEFGRGLVDSALRIYAEAEEVEHRALDTARRPRGLVRLAVPMAFGVCSVAPLMPKFFELYPDVAVDLHLSDDKVDLIGDGFDAALRIAVLEDSSLVAKLIAPVRRFVIAAPGYLARYGRPQHPDDLAAHRCMGYAYRAKRDIWRFSSATGELPEFIAAQYLRSGELEALLPDWQMALGGLYFVTPTARARSAKVEALSRFLVDALSDPPWRMA
jgi:DNA-binding transcriptional LysR family regulator